MTFEVLYGTKDFPEVAACLCCLLKAEKTIQECTATSTVKKVVDELKI